MPEPPAGDHGGPAVPQGFIDNPRPGGVVGQDPWLLWGWVLFPSGPAARVDISAGGAACGPARLGMERLDVAEALGLPRAAISGFQSLVTLPPIAGGGEVTVTATATGINGERFEPAPVVVRMAERPPADPTSPPAEPTSSPSTPPRDRSGRVRLLVFAHDLAYGGAQLYLSELLTRLCGRPGYEAVVVSPTDGPLRAVLQAAGIRIHLIGAYPSRGPDAYESTLGELASWADQQGFTAVIANTILAFPGADLAWRLGLPCIWAIHESYRLEAAWAALFPSGLPEPYVRRRAELALRRADVLVFEARATMSLYQCHRSGHRPQLRTIPYGISLAGIDACRSILERAAARRERAIPERATLLLCVGTFESRKAQSSIVQAFEAVAGDFPDAHVALVGDAPGRFSEAVHTYVSAAGLGDRVTIAPVTPDVLTWYGIADVLVVASDIESLPRTILEAMAFGVPVLATGVFGVSELIDDGRTGWMCQERDVRQLSTAMRRVLTLTPGERRSVGAAGERVVRERHDAAGYAAAYHELISSLSESA